MKIFTKKTLLPCGFGFFIFILSILFLEIYHSDFYYFTQDDCYHEFLPTVLYGCKALFENGMLAEINPHQWAGIPLASVGKTALLYPPTYLSYLIAHYILKNDLYLLEIFIIFHLSLAYFFSYFAARSCKNKNYIAVIFALCYSLSGFNLITTRSWGFFSPYIAYAPCIILSVNYLITHKPNYKWIFFSGLFLGLAGISGHPEMYIWTMSFFVLTFIIVFLVQKIDFEKFWHIIYPILIAVIISTPQNYVLFRLFKNMNRNISHLVSFGNINNFSFQSFFIPIPFENSTVYYSGSLFLIIVIIALAFLIGKKSEYVVDFFQKNPFFIVGIIAFLLVLPASKGLFFLVHLLPIFNQFRWSFKLMLFVNLFLNISGAIILSRLKIATNKKFKISIIGIMLASLCFFLFNADSSFNDYSRKPYPIKNNIISLLKHDDYRIFHNGRNNGRNNELLLETFGGNLATYYNLYSASGYNVNKFECELPENKILFNLKLPFEKYKNQINSSKNLPYDILAKYGVRYLFFISNEKILTPEIEIATFINKKVYEMYTMNRYVYLRIFELKNYDPLAFYEEDNKKIMLPVKFFPQGAIINIKDIKKNTQKITLAMTYYPSYHAFIGDKEFVITKDNYNRMIINISEYANKDELVVKYKSPWDIGFLISFVLTIFLFITLLYEKKKNEKL